MDWNNINRDRDTSGLGPIEYDQTKVPELIRKHADNVRTKTFGQEVREAQARNAELAGLIASEAEILAESANVLSNDVKKRYDEQISNNSNLDEVIDARSLFNQESFPLLRNQLEAIQGVVNVKAFGAKGDGLTNDQDAINAAIDFADKNGIGNVVIPYSKKPYMIKGFEDGQIDNLEASTGIILKSGITLIIHPKAELKIIASDRGSTTMFNVYNVSDVNIYGGKLIGDKHNHLGTTGEHGYGIALAGAENVIIENVVCSQFWGDGINLQRYRDFYPTEIFGVTVEGKEANRNIIVNNVLCDDNRRQGMSVEAVDRMQITNSQFNNTSGTAPQSGIDIEPWVRWDVKDITIFNVTCSGNLGHGIMTYEANLGDLYINKFTAENNGLADLQVKKSTANSVTVINSKFDIVAVVGNYEMDKVTIKDNDLKIVKVYDSLFTEIENNRIVSPSEQIYKPTNQTQYQNKVVVEVLSDNIEERVSVKIKNNVLKGIYNTYFKVGINLGGKKQQVEIKGNRISNYIFPIQTYNGNYVVEDNHVINAHTGYFNGVSSTGKNIIKNNIFEACDRAISGSPVVASNEESEHFTKGNYYFRYPLATENYDPSASVNEYKLAYITDDNFTIDNTPPV